MGVILDIYVVANFMQTLAVNILSSELIPLSENTKIQTFEIN